MVRYIKDEDLFFKLNMGYGNDKLGLVTLRDLYSLVIGLLPVIMVFRVPFWGKGLSTVLLGLFVPYVLVEFFQSRHGKSWGLILPAAICFGYFIFRGRDNIESMFTMLVSFVHIVCASRNTISLKTVRKTIETVAVVSSAIVIFQSAVFYIWKKETFIINWRFVIDNMQYYFLKENGALYRPSGLFMEPSHMGQYASVALASLLCDDKKGNRKKTAVVVLGTVLTTSGIGIVLCVGVVLWRIVFRAFSMNIKRGTATLVLGALGIVAVSVVGIRLPVIGTAVQRIVGKVDGYNAIWGRTLFYKSIVGRLKGNELLWGKGNLDLPDVYMTGHMQIVRCYGYIGLALLVATVLMSAIISGKNRFAWCISFIYIGLLFVANNVGFIGICFWIGMIYAAAAENIAYAAEKKRKRKYSDMTFSRKLIKERHLFGKTI